MEYVYNETRVPKDTEGSGCDHHAVCSFCLPNENCAKLVLEGVLQAANMAMVLVADLPTTCAMYSCGAD